MSSRRQRVAFAAGAAAVVIALVIVALVNGGGSSPPPATSAPAVSSTTSATTSASSTSPGTTVTAPPPPLTPGPPARQPRPRSPMASTSTGCSTTASTAGADRLPAGRAPCHRGDRRPQRRVLGGAEPRRRSRRPRLRWSFNDKIAGSLAAHELRWLPIIDYSALWAESTPGQDHSPPASPADYAAYAAAFAARYGPGGSFWSEHPALTPEPVQTYEIWNEPDNGAVLGAAPNPAAYAALYMSGARGDRRRRSVGTGDHRRPDQPDGFLPAMLAARPQLRGHIDGVAIHPYGTPLVALAKVSAARARWRAGTGRGAAVRDRVRLDHEPGRRR